MNKDGKFNMRLEPPILKELDKMALDHGRNRNAEIRQLVIEALRRHSLQKARRDRVEKDLLGKPYKPGEKKD